MTSVQTLHVTDPIPRVLEHYERELRDTLERIGIPHESAPVPAIEGLGAVGKVTTIVRTLARARSMLAAREPVLQLWPSFGLLDALTWRSTNATAGVIFHDPTPIRDQFGYGTLPRWIVGAVSRRNAPIIVSHSRDASIELHDLFPRYSHVRVAHPVLSQQAVRPPRRGRPTVLVAGQYKPERHLDLLAVLGPQLSALGFAPRIVGRGWPRESLPGWDIHNSFVPDGELAAEIAAAALVLIPYRRFFQSGILLRAIESSVPVIAPDCSFVRDVLGPSSPWIVRTDDARAWSKAAIHAADDPSPVTVSFERYREKCDLSWHALWTAMQ